MIGSSQIPIYAPFRTCPRQDNGLGFGSKTKLRTMIKEGAGFIKVMANGGVWRQTMPASTSPRTPTILRSATTIGVGRRSESQTETV